MTLITITILLFSQIEPLDNSSFIEEYEQEAINIANEFAVSKNLQSESFN